MVCELDISIIIFYKLISIMFYWSITRLESNQIKLIIKQNKNRNYYCEIHVIIIMI
jgi:hypothetical protein